MSSTWTRQGASPIDLIDRDRLCDLLKCYDVGVRAAVRAVEDVTTNADLLRDFKGQTPSGRRRWSGHPA
jgi:hypothetical protein